MTTRAVEQLDEWESSPFRDGYRGLRELADREFSGIVEVDVARLCMLNGTAVGVLDGDVDDFEDASGTAYESPSSALPLLGLMQERNEEVRARYYSEDTPLSEVDGTLADGGFTGYIELSENVLSGDYYVVYHQGRSMAVAWVGNTGQVLTDDEAFDRADDEVGIFQVRPAELEPVEVPGVGGTGTASADEASEAADAAAGAGATDSTSTPSDTDETPVDGSAADAGDDVVGADTGARDDIDSVADATETDTDSVAATDPGEAGGAGEDSTEPDVHDPDATDTASATEASGDSTGPAASTPDRTDAARSDRGDSVRPDRPAESTDDSPASERANRDLEGESSGRQRDRDADQTADTGEVDATHETGREPSTATDASGSAADTTGPTDAGASGSSDTAGAPDRLATRTVPSLNPSRTTTASSESESTDATDPADAAGGPATDERADPPRSHRSGAAPDRGPTDAAPESSERIADLEVELAERDAEIGELEADLSAVESKREGLRAQLEDVRAERDDLREERDQLQSTAADLEAEVERLESQLDEMEAEFGAAVDAERRLDPGEALDQTNLFVRYESRGQATLEAAHAGEAAREAVNQNLGLEYHTQFEDEDASVDGRPFGEFLRQTMQYQFVTWVVSDLLYEIQDTGKVAELRDLYDAIPEVDRAELNGTVATEYVEGGQEQGSQESFDVVMRDRMGNALLTANVNDSRQAASESMMSSLVTASTHVEESDESLGASFLVTSSFFEPEALETAAEVTSGGLLSRDKRASFVKLSRKQGYHLCLVEAREDKFHLAVPEL